MNVKSLLLAVALGASATSFAQNYKKGNPNDPNYAYLNDYAPLKAYVDRSKYPNFKLGIGTTVSEYLKKSTVYNLTNDNFDETVAGNAMKMASCVDGNGNMNFGTVTNYVNTATNAGLVVYGHTLAWHSQQPNGWLRGLIKDKPAVPFEKPDTTLYVNVKSKDLGVDKTVGWHSDFTQYSYNITFDATNGMKVTNTKSQTNYLVQYIGMDGIPTESGKTYRITMKIKGSKAGSVSAKLGDWNNGDTKTFSFSTAWKEVSVTYTAKVANSFLLLQSGSFVGDIYVKEIKVEEPVGAMKIKKSEAGDLYYKEVKDFRKTQSVGWTSDKSTYGYSLSFDTTNGLKIHTTKVCTNPWDVQFIAVENLDLKAGKTYYVTFDIKGSKSGKLHTKFSDWGEGPTGDVAFTTSWQEVTLSYALTVDNAFLLLQCGDFVGDIYVRNITVSGLNNNVIEDGDYCLVLPQSTPRTMEEKREILQGAMEKWISGMMKACNGKVKAWDVVNEAISGGGNDGSGNYTLQHSTGFNGNATWDVGGDAFYWQDHMGDLEYVRSAVKYARQYGPADVKLFINDYNLESTWDDNKKLKSLINWIKKWEADGVTKIDGIGTQMHISYILDKNQQENQKKHITSMFELMAATGKLVRVSELDMGVCEKQFATAKKTSEITEEQHKLMADYYEWIIKEYLRIIPPAQQWGICQWCPTDSPTNSGWRGGEPVGIWTLDTYYRKHVYAGFARGLSGQSATDIEENVVSDKSYDAKGIININGVRMPQNMRFEDLPKGIYIINGKKVKK